MSSKAMRDMPRRGRMPRVPLVIVRTGLRVVLLLGLLVSLLMSLLLLGRHGTAFPTIAGVLAIAAVAATVTLFVMLRVGRTRRRRPRPVRAPAASATPGDPLTGLASRAQADTMIEAMLGHADEAHRAGAVLLVDLDRFAQVNDTLGHRVGDTLLRYVARRLEGCIDPASRLARVGSDEFVIIVPDRRDTADLAALAQTVIATLSRPFSISERQVSIGASVGVAIAPGDGASCEALMRSATLALHAAQGAGRGSHRFYAEGLHAEAQLRSQLENDLREALAAGALELHYQPIVQTRSDRVTGFEALLRWTHPTLGPLSPARFVPIAEATGLIAPIGEWALRTAARDLALWPENVRVAVNVSPRQFRDAALPAIVASACAQAGIAPARLELEITESVLLDDCIETDATFAALKQVGVRLALDDFGTGYASLGYLRKAPFDKIKIDQSFVRGATVAGSRNGAIIAAIVSLADALGMETTAEGVETFDELDLVRELGCSQVQGFAYARPMPCPSATALLENGPRLVAHGRPAARAARLTTVCMVQLEHGDQRHAAMVRNLSRDGAMIECLWWHAPPGTRFRILPPGEGPAIEAVSHWSRDNRIGAAFLHPGPFAHEALSPPPEAAA